MIPSCGFLLLHPLSILTAKWGPLYCSDLCDLCFWIYEQLQM
uniref:Uncharacterized protein n=1 Tax=Anguilla anguilla TaxID=7936 RepID=A0A0E9VJH0_ANGAN